MREQMPETVLIVGGPEVRYHAEQLLDHGAGYGWLGRRTDLSELIQELHQGKEPLQVSGLIFAQPMAPFIAVVKEIRSKTWMSCHYLPG